LALAQPARASSCFDVGALSLTLQLISQRCSLQPRSYAKLPIYAKPGKCRMRCKHSSRGGLSPNAIRS
jgi:hypothetical protein